MIIFAKNPMNGGIPARFIKANKIMILDFCWFGVIIICLIEKVLKYLKIEINNRRPRV